MIEKQVYWIANSNGLLPKECYETVRDAERYLESGEFIVPVTLKYEMPPKTVTINKSQLDELFRSAGLDPEAITLKTLAERLGL